MSTQIAVRLPDATVEFLDRAVASGEVSSRAELVAAALEREMRQRSAARDATILAVSGPADDLDDLVAWSVSRIDLQD